MDGWIDKWMDGWIYKPIDTRTVGWMDDRCIDRWMDGWMDEWMYDG